MGRIGSTLVCLGLVWAPGVSFAEAPLTKILVLRVRAEPGVPQGTANLLGELLVEDVHHSGRYQVISAEDMAAVLGVEEQKKIVGCEEDTNCLAEIGNALGAELILEARVGAIGPRRVLALKLIDPRQVEVRARDTETVDNDEALIAATHRLVAKVLSIPLKAGVEAPKDGLRPAWFVLGGGALLVAVGAVFGGLALSDFNSFEENPADAGLGDSAQTKGYVADGLYLGGGLALSAGLIWLLLDGDQP